MDEIRDLRDLFAGHAIQSTYPDKATAEKAFEKMMAAHDVWVNTRTGETFKVEATPARLSCPKCGGDVRDADDGPYRACVACGHVTDSDPGYC
jgi:predicted RNA-binding Zn-ribbon protein involved in translation (DUF1610 family)